MSYFLRQEREGRPGQTEAGLQLRQPGHVRRRPQKVQVLTADLFYTLKCPKLCRIRV